MRKTPAAHVLSAIVLVSTAQVQWCRATAAVACHKATAANRHSILLSIDYTPCFLLHAVQEEQEPEYEFLGCFKTVIVGIRYYTGRVGVNEVSAAVVAAAVS